jgi:hypothetical protein
LSRPFLSTMVERYSAAPIVGALGAGAAAFPFLLAGAIDAR